MLQLELAPTSELTVTLYPEDAPLDIAISSSGEQELELQQDFSDIALSFGQTQLPVDLEVTGNNLALEFAPLSQRLVIELATFYTGPSSEDKRLATDITYTNGLISRIDYSDGTYKIYNYEAGKLVRIDNSDGTSTTLLYDSQGLIIGTRPDLV